MAAILLKAFSAVMSVIVTLSGMFPLAFGNKVYIDPVENTVVLGESFLTEKHFDEPTVITDLETAKKLFNEDECGELNGKFFEKYNMICVPVTLPSTSYKVFVSSIAEKGDTAEIKYSLVTDGCVGAAMICRETICVAVSKNIEKVEASGMKIVVPFCIHEN